MNIAGTRWAGIEVGGPGNGYIELFFGEDGGCTLNNAGGVVAGSWQQFENTIYFELNDKYSEWSGTVNPISGGMHGNAINKAGEGWSWAVDMYEEGSLTPPRTLWGARFNALDLIQDRLGLGLDPGIKRSVLAVQLMGLETVYSCEGHTNWAQPGPVIRFRRDGIFRKIRGDIKRQWLDSFYKDRHFDSDLAICPKEFMRGEISSINISASNSLPLAEKEEFLKASRQEMSDFTDFVLYTLFEDKIPQVIQDLPQLTEQPLTDAEIH